MENRPNLLAVSYRQPMNNTPFYSRLPQETPEIYQGNSVVSWLCSYWDDLYYSTQEKLKQLPRQFDPEFCDEEYLNFLAPLCGFTAPYWDDDYLVGSKRLLLKNAYTQIWSNKGSLNQLSFVLTALNIEHRIITPGSFIIGEGQLNIDPLGSGGWQFTVLLPEKYNEGGEEYLLTRKIVDLFTPAWCEGFVIVKIPVIEQDVILALDTNIVLDINNETDIYVESMPGIVADTAGTVTDPTIVAEEINLKIR